MTVYITKATTNNFMTYEQQLIDKKAGLRRKEPVQSIYDYMVSKVYRKMFSQPSIWQGYQDFDPDEQTEKIYVK